MRFITLFISMLFATISLFGFEQMQFIHFDKSNNFPFSTVDNIMQDSYGYLWIGSTSGLARYDGYSFEVFTEQDKKGLTSNRIFCTRETSNGDILVGTNLGFVVYDRKLNNFKLLSYSCTPEFQEDKNNQVWVATFDGIDVRDSKTLEIKTSFFCEADNNIKVFAGITIDSIGRAWASTSDNGIYVFDTKKNEFIKHIDSNIIPDIEQYKIKNLKFDNNGILWIGTEGNGLICYDTLTNGSKKITSVESDPSTIGSNNIANVYVDSKNDVWICCQYGYLNRYRRQNNSFERFTPQVYNARFINANSVSCIYEDNGGNYWIGTSGEGMYYFNNVYNNFQTFISLPDYYNRNSIGSITSFAELENGTIVLASNGGGIKFYNPKNNTVKEFVNNKLLSSPNIVKIMKKGNELWGATWGGGAFRIDLNTNNVRNFVYDVNNPNSINMNILSEIYADDTALVIGTHGAGLAFYNHEKDIFTHKDNSKGVAFDPIINNWVNHIYRDSRGNLWISTFYGLIRINDNRIKRYETDSSVNSINAFEVLSTYEDSANRLWVLTAQGVDLYDYENDDFTRLGPVLLLPNNTRSLVEDKNGCMWLCSDDELVKLSYKDMTTVVFDKNDGIISGEFNMNASFKASDGTIYLGSSDGFMKFNPSMLETDLTKPKLLFRNLFVNYNKQIPDSVYLTQTLETVDTLEYKYNEDVVSIEVAAILLSRLNKINYAYTFNKEKNEWLKLGKDRVISFTALRPGKYTLSIKASVENGSSNQKDITIIVKPKWWMTWWFLTVVLLLIVGIVVQIISRRLRKITDQNILLERLVEERTLDLRDLNKKLKKKSEILRNHIVNLKESQIVIKMKNEELTEALNMKDRLIGVISHDFKNPLSALTGIMSILKSNKLDLKKAEADSLIANAEIIIKKLSNQMFNVLDWAQEKLQNIKVKQVEVNLEPLIIDAIQIAGIAAQQKKITIETQCNYRYNAYVDPRMISTIFRNILSNAIKFTPEGGNIVVIMDEVEKMHEISFVDTGVGMPEEKVKTLLEEFNLEYVNYGTNAEKGYGLGLQLSKTFVQKNEGTISVTSEEGKGSVFTVSLPKGKTMVSKLVIDESDDESSIKQDVLELDSTQEYSVLLIDDNEELVSILQTTFSASNFKVIKAFEGRSGLYLARNMVPDIIISDIYMPEVDGLELCKQLKSDRMTCHIPVILISSEKRENIEEACYKNGANDFLEKPFDPELLKQKIVRMLNIITNRKDKTENDTDLHFELPESKDDQIIKKIIELLTENIENPDYDVDTIAAEIGLSRTQLWRKTKQALKKTPSEIIRDIRLKKACEMLKTGKYRISDVAYHVGYNDPKVFQRNFSNMYGMTPTDYAKQYNND